MKRAILVAVLVAFAQALAADKGSCVKAIERANKAVSALASTQAPVYAEVGLVAKEKKISFTRELGDGTYSVMAVGDDKAGPTFILSLKDSKGKELKKGKAVNEVFVQDVTLEAKDKTTVELECEDANFDKTHYIIVVLQKYEGAKVTSEVVFEHLAARAKAVEESGHQVVWAELDTLADGKPWTVTHKLDAGKHAFEIVGDDDRIKDFEVEVKDGSGQSVAKKEKAKEPKDGHLASLAGDAKAGDAKVTVTGVFQEGNKDSFAGVLIAKK
ncbi:MAG TPA: hypothetical protein VFF73_31195 [Planctomycetota bacterium]|nr:hypothetical protein [Planctomycetota bacterium]